MNEDQLGPIVSSWLKEENRPPSHPDRSVRTAMNAAQRTRQLRRWRWLPPFVHRLSEPPSTAPDIDQMTDYQPTSIPATNGHTPTVTRRTRSMLSPAKAITAGALVFAIGGTLLVAQPFDQQGSVPGAEAEAVEPTWVTGTVEFAEDCRRGGPASSENGVVHESFDCRDEVWTADDPRLTGEVRKMWTSDGYRTEAAGYRSVIANRYIMDTEGGTWECQSVQVGRGTGIMANTRGHDTITCVGDGAHEGLTAVVQADWGEAGHPFEAIVFSGEVPPAPDASDFE